MKTILITGRTDLITKSILEQISGRFSIVLTSEDKDRKEDDCRVYYMKPGTTSFEQLFWAYDFTTVWHIMAYSDYGKEEGAIKELEAVYKQCRENHIRKLLVVSSSLVSEEMRQAEEKLLFAEKHSQPWAFVVRAPGILAEGNVHGFLGSIFSALYHRSRTIRIPDVDDGSYEFLSVQDLVGLLKKITLSAPESGVYHLSGEYVISREQLRREMTSISNRSRILSDGRNLKRAESAGSGDLSRKYVYYAKDQKQLDFRKYYDAFASEERCRSGGILTKIAGIHKRIPRQVVKVVDIVVLFFLAEYISKFTSDFVYFKDIDVRLIYIFLIATFHGLKAGVAASLAECVVLYYEYQTMGIHGLQLFYNVENWIPFALCIVTGAVTGYFSDLRESEKNLVDRENSLLREKYLFLNDMYNVSSEIRDEYRRQILTFENSYGKIYDAVERMNCDTVNEVCGKAWKVLTKLLDNSTIEICRRGSSGETLEVLFASERFSGEDREIMITDAMIPMFDEFGKDKVFRNMQLEPGVPMYGASLKPCPAGHEEAGYEPVLVLAWDALPEQMNDYYANQFEILCRLTGDALNRAALLECSRGSSAD